MKEKSYARLVAFFVVVMLTLGIFTLQPSTRAQVTNEGPDTEQSAPRIDFSRLAIMGDSLSQSYQDGVIRASAQMNNYASLLAKQVNTELRQALIADPGGYGQLFRFRNSSLPVRPLNINTFMNLDIPMPVPAGQRVDPSVRVNNFAIGGAQVTDIINARPDPNNINTPLHASLGIPWLMDNPPVMRSQLEFVEAMNPRPTAIILFIGGNDALGAASTSNLDLLTPASKFRTDYEEIVRRAKATGAQMILVTVPDIPLVPAFISQRDLATIAGVAPELLELGTGIRSGDFITLRTFPTLLAILNRTITGPVPKDQILTKKQARKISRTIKQYNDAITAIGRRENFLVVDINALLKDLSTRGVTIPGVATITNKYFGGTGSLDGVHLTDTANALLANFFIDNINNFYRTSFQKVDVAPIAMNDPLVPKMGGTVAPSRIPTQQEYLEMLPTLEALGKAFVEVSTGKKQQ
ncbi:MAG: hypothetical protein JNN15_13815 [Blastocatellia bacterium]|nr:hypothetical protein [Blastocatellia bacterium]